MRSESGIVAWLRRWILPRAQDEIAALEAADREKTDLVASLRQQLRQQEELLAELQASDAARDELSSTLRQIASPVLPILEEVVVVPITGELDTGRVEQLLSDVLAEIERHRTGSTQRLTQQLEALTGLETRLTILGHTQRGGTPSAADRLLATRLGTACATLINDGVFGVMVAKHGDITEPVPLEEVVGKRKTVPLDHPWIESARRVGTSLGD